MESAVCCVKEMKSSLQSFASQLEEVKNAQNMIISQAAESVNQCDQNSTNSMHKKVEEIVCNQPANPPVDLNSIIAKVSQQIEELYIKYNLISSAVSKLENAIDELEQYGRRNCIIIHGLSPSNLPDVHKNYPAFVDHIIAKLNSQLGLNLFSHNVDIAHPLPVAKNGKTPIIVKFVRRSDRNAILHKKRLFASSGLAVTESLTKKRLTLLNEARFLIGQKEVWTFNGSIYCYINSSRELITSQDDLYRLVSKIGLAD